MADMTVYPDTLELGMSLETVTLPGAMHTESVTTLQLGVELQVPDISITFPNIARDPNLNFRDQPSGEAVLIGSTASGYPVINKVATFEPQDFEFEMPSVPDADKIIIMEYYKANKDKSFPWLNKQDNTVYEVIFTAKPTCRLGGSGGFWNMFFKFRQVTP